VVRCGPSGRRNFITDPLVIVEVLSPTTMDTDRGEKLRFCKGLPTLRHIALVYQEQVRVEHYRRTEQGELAILLRPDAELAFEAMGFRIGLSQAYFGVDQTIGGLSARSG
jgi:Uma2 family endonuclease